MICSEFLGKSLTVDVLQKFEGASFKLRKQKCIQISSDGSNVNWKFLDLLNEQHRDECLNELISIDTCGIPAELFKMLKIQQIGISKSFISYA